MNRENPTITKGINNIPSFFFLTEEQFRHFISYKKPITAISNYDDVREVFSQEDIAKIHMLNENLFNKLLPKSVMECDYNPISSHYNDHLNYIGEGSFGYIWKGTEKQASEYMDVILPLAMLELKKYESNKPDRVLVMNKIEDNEFIDFQKSYKFYPMGLKDYYLIVIDESFKIALQIRSKLKEFISECLKLQYSHLSIEEVASSSLYRVYLNLLKFEQKGLSLL